MSMNMTRHEWVNEYNLSVLPEYRQYLGEKGGSPAPIPGELPYWSGKFLPPSIGDRVTVNFNEFGKAVVTGYFVENGFLGFHCRPTKRPKWHVQQDPDRDVICVFGIEFTPLESGMPAGAPASPQVPR